MVKIRGSNLMKKISREDLLKKNKKLVEEYENRKLFINKKRKVNEPDKNNSNNDISSEETQLIHKRNKNKIEKKIIKQQLKQNQKKLINNDAINKMKQSKIKNIDNNINKNYKEDTTAFNEREGKLLYETPKKVLNVGYKNRSDKKLYCLVEWKQVGKVLILDSIVECERLKENYSNLLLDFYESKLVFLDDE